MRSKTALILTPASSRLERQKHAVIGAQRQGYEVKEFSTKVPDDNAEFAICSGFRKNSLVGRQFCAAHGIPVMIVELGYLRRSNGNTDTAGYFQCGWERIGWMPQGPVPDDRWRALGLTLQPLKEITGGQYILLAGQVGFDAQHNLSSADLTRWLMQEGRAANAEIGNTAPLVYRPHPMQPHTRLLSTLKHVRQDPKTVSMDAAMAGARLLVTYNSTTGVEAMLRGVRVRSHPSAHYHTAAASTDEGTRQDYMHRLAYAQWTLTEMAEGKNLEFLLQHR